MYEELVEEVIAEVLERIQSHSCITKEHPQKICLVLGSLDKDKKQMLCNNYQVMEVIGKASESSEAMMELVSRTELILITRFTVSNLCSIANGNCMTELEEYISDALLLGKEIVILETALVYRAYKTTSSRNYYRKLLEHEKTLINYGIKIKTEPEFFLCNKENLSEETKVQESSSDRVVFNRMLLTEKELLCCDFHSTNKVLVPKKSIITPMAMDYIREHNLELIRQ